MSDPKTAEDTSTTFRGWAVTPSSGGKVEPWDYHPRPLEDEDIEIEISHCGICGSDVHYVTGGWGPITRPVVAGHEIIGTVTKKGSKAKHNIGDRVGVGCIVASCRASKRQQCKQCLAHEDQLCEEFCLTFSAPYKDGRGGISQGGFSEKMRVYSDYAFKIPDEIESHEAASLFCAGITVFKPLLRYKAGPKVRVGVVGIGGLGHLALQMARALGCPEVVAISGRDDKKDEAFKLGATKFINTSNPDQVKEAAESMDLILCTNASKSFNWTQMFGMVAKLGTAVLLALPEQEISFMAGALVNHDVSFAGCHLGSKENTIEMLEFCSKHNIRPWVELRDFKEINEALEKVHHGSPRYRVVLEHRK